MALLLSCCSLTVYGAGSGSVDISSTFFYAAYLSGGKLTYTDRTISKGQSVTLAAYRDIFVCRYTWAARYDFTPNQDWTITFDFISPQYLKGYDIYITGEQASLSNESADDKLLTGDDVFYIYHAGTQSGNTLTVQFTPSISTNSTLLVYFVNRSFGQSGADTGNYNLGYHSINIDYEDQKEGILSGVKQFFTDLGDRISQWFNSVKEWFTQLGDRISSFFSELGDRISGFFEQLTSKISEIWEALKTWFNDNIITPITNWWDNLVARLKYLFGIPDGLGDNLKDDWEAWLEEHLGFVWAAGELVSRALNEIVDAFASDSPNTVSIPEIKLPDVLGGYTILEARTFDFNALLEDVPMLGYLYNIYVVFAYGLALFMLVRLGVNTLEEILADREVTD